MNIKSFSNFDDFLSSIRQSNQAAEEVTLPWQREIAPEMYFLKYVPEMQLCIYGKVLDPADVSEVTDEDERAEIIEEASMYQEEHMKLYRFTKCYSQLVTHGELGDTHVSTMTVLLSQAQFNLAMTLKWPSDPEGIKKILAVKSS